MLRGNYPATVDQKGRLKIPVHFLAELQGLGEEFYVTSENGDHARIYPMKYWSEIEERLAQLSTHNRTKRKFLTRANYFGQAVRMDKQGRVLLPAVLRESAQMTGDVDVLGNLKYLEVWNHGRYMEYMRNNPITEEDEKILDDLGI